MTNFSAPADIQQQRVASQAKEIHANHFFNLLTDTQLLDVVEAHLPDHRERQYTPTVTLSMFLGQAMSADSSCQQAVNQANVSRLVSGLKENSARTGGYCSARKRLPLEMVQVLAQHTGSLIATNTQKAWKWRGREVKIVDGTTITLPDTPSNQEHYPQHVNQSEGVGFPLARLVGLVSLSTGAIIDVAMGPHKGKGTGEYGLFRKIRHNLVKDDMLLADSYFCSYFLLADLISRGVDFLFEQHGARDTDFRRGRKLGARDHEVIWLRPARPSWMSYEEYQCQPKEIRVREVKAGKKILVTSLLDSRKTAKGSLESLYWQRWNVELDLRNIKTTLGMERLSCMSPDMCEKEMWVYILAYNLIRLLMVQAAFNAGMLPREISFKHTLQMWLAWSQLQRRIESSEDESLDILFQMISQVKVGNRPGRIEPRAVKRRPKPYPRLSKPRIEERERLKKHGHEKKQGLN